MWGALLLSGDSSLMLNDELPFLLVDGGFAGMWREKWKGIPLSPYLTL
jgi:hypothetical protein